MVLAFNYTPHANKEGIQHKVDNTKQFSIISNSGSQDYHQSTVQTHTSDAILLVSSSMMLMMSAILQSLGQCSSSTRRLLASSLKSTEPDRCCKLEHPHAKVQEIYPTEN